MSNRNNKIDFQIAETNHDNESFEDLKISCVQDQEKFLNEENKGNVNSYSNIKKENENPSNRIEKDVKNEKKQPSLFMRKIKSLLKSKINKKNEQDIKYITEILNKNKINKKSSSTEIYEKKISRKEYLSPQKIKEKKKFQPDFIFLSYIEGLFKNPDKTRLTLLTKEKEKDSKEPSIINNKNNLESSKYHLKDEEGYLEYLKKKKSLKNIQEAKMYLDSQDMGYMEEGVFQRYKLSHHIDKFQNQGEGIFFFFFFMKFWTIIFFIMALISILPLVYNIIGSGLGGYADQFKLLKTVLGNINQNNSGENNESEETIFYINVGCDFAYSCIFFLSIYIYRFIVRRKRKIVEQMTVSVSDYSLIFSGFPSTNLTKNEVILFLKKLGNYDIIRVDFAYKFKGCLTNMMEIVEQNNLQNEYKSSFEATNKAKKKIKLAIKYNAAEKVIQKNLDFMKKKLKKERLIFDDFHNNFEINYVFVTFNNSQDTVDVFKLLERKYKWFNFDVIFNRIKTEFKGKHIKCDFPDSPNNIKFENLEVSSLEKNLKIVLIFFLSLILILIFFILQIFFRSYIDKNNPQFVCDTNIFQNPDFNDLLSLFPNEKNKVVFCYCSNLPLQELYENNECKDYIEYFFIEIFLVSTAIGIILAIVNVIIEELITYLTKYVKKSSKTSELVLKTNLVFLLSYVNTALSIVVLYSYTFTTFLEKLIGSKWVNVPKSRQKEALDAHWFYTAGVKILTLQIIIIISPSLVLLILSPLIQKFKNWRASKKKLQYEYIQLKTKRKFELHFYMTQLLLMIFFCLTFCGGFPLSLLITFVGFLICFWCYKIFFIYYSKKTPLYGFKFVNSVSKTLPYALVIHLCFSIFFYSQETIFPHSKGFQEKWTDFFKKMNFQSMAVQDFIKGCAKSLPLFILLVIVVVFIIGEMFLYNLIALLFKFSKRVPQNETYRTNYKKIKYNSKQGYDFTYLQKYAHLGEIFKRNCFFFFKKAKLEFDDLR